VAPSCTLPGGRGEAGGSGTCGVPRGDGSRGDLVVPPQATLSPHPRDADLTGAMACRGLGTASLVARWDSGSPKLCDLHGVTEQSVGFPPSPPCFLELRWAGGCSRGGRWPAPLGAARGRVLRTPLHPTAPGDPQGTAPGDPGAVPPTSPGSGRVQGCYGRAGLGRVPPAAENMDSRLFPCPATGHRRARQPPRPGERVPLPGGSRGDTGSWGDVGSFGDVGSCGDARSRGDAGSHGDEPWGRGEL